MTTKLANTQFKHLLFPFKYFLFHASFMANILLEIKYGPNFFTTSNPLAMQSHFADN